MSDAHAAESEGLPPPGHYAGLTTQGQPISFEVVDRGTSVSCLTFKIDSSSFGAIIVTDEPIAITASFAIDSDGRFGGTVNGDGIRARVSGRLTLVGIARGTLEVDLAVANERVDVECSSGCVRWRGSD